MIVLHNFTVLGFKVIATYMYMYMYTIHYTWLYFSTEAFGEWDKTVAQACHDEIKDINLIRKCKCKNFVTGLLAHSVLKSTQMAASLTGEFFLSIKSIKWCHSVTLSHCIKALHAHYIDAWISGQNILWLCSSYSECSLDNQQCEIFAKVEKGITSVLPTQNFPLRTWGQKALQDLFSKMWTFPDLLQRFCGLQVVYSKCQNVQHIHKVTRLHISAQKFIDNFAKMVLLSGASLRILLLPSCLSFAFSKALRVAKHYYFREN